MSLWRTQMRSALLVDLDNIAGQVGGNALMNSIAAWLAWLEDGQFDPRRRRRELVSKIAYWNTPTSTTAPPSRTQDLKRNSVLRGSKVEAWPT